MKIPKIPQGPATEVISIAVWTISAVKVTGYTWQAYTGTKLDFPTLGGGGSSSDVNNAVVQGVRKIPVVGNTAVNITQWVSRGVANLIYAPLPSRRTVLHVDHLPPPDKRVTGAIYVTPAGNYDSNGNKLTVTPHPGK